MSVKLLCCYSRNIILLWYWISPESLVPPLKLQRYHTFFTGGWKKSESLEFPSVLLVSLAWSVGVSLKKYNAVRINLKTLNKWYILWEVISLPLAWASCQHHGTVMVEPLYDGSVAAFLYSPVWIGSWGWCCANSVTLCQRKDQLLRLKDREVKKSIEVN